MSLMVTSCPHISLGHVLERAKKLEVRASFKDMQSYLNRRISCSERLAPLCKHNTNLRKDIVDTIAGRAQGT